MFTIQKEHRRKRSVPRPDVIFGKAFKKVKKWSEKDWVERAQSTGYPSSMSLIWHGLCSQARRDLWCALNICPNQRYLPKNGRKRPETGTLTRRWNLLPPEISHKKDKNIGVSFTLLTKISRNFLSMVKERLYFLVSSKLLKGYGCR